MTNRRPIIENRLSTVAGYNAAFLFFMYLASLLFQLIFCRNGDCAASPLGDADFVKDLIKSVVHPPFVVPLTMGHGSPSVGVMIAYATHGVLGALVPFWLGRHLHTSMVGGWLSSNAPLSIEEIKKFSTRLILGAKLILPLFVGDVVSLVCGILGLPTRSVLVAIFVAESVRMVSAWAVTGIHGTSVGLVTASSVISLFVYDYTLSAKGVGFYHAAKTFIHRLIRELIETNEVDGIEAIEPVVAKNETIVLAYGFFSSRRSVVAMKRRLERAGYAVVVPRLPGFLDVFNTDGIRHTSETIELACLRLSESGTKYHVVGFSKGALAASYMFATHGNDLGASTFISIAAPYNGSRYTYIVLCTPMGFFWRDVWDMRPGSKTLKIITDRLPKITGPMKMASIYSQSDRVAGIGARMSFAASETAETDMEHKEFLISPATVTHILAMLDEDQHKET